MTAEDESLAFGSMEYVLTPPVNKRGYNRKGQTKIPFPGQDTP